MGEAYDLGDLRLADLQAFLAVQRTGSLSASARELRVTPSQISKALARLEEHAGARLLTRGAHGARLTEVGHRIAPQIADAVSSLRAMRPGEQPASPATVGLAGPAYLLAAVVPVLVGSSPSLRLRTTELPPAQIRSLFADDAFEIALLPGVVGKLPASWASHGAGELRKVLLGSPAAAAALGSLPCTAERVRERAFVGPTYRPSGPFVAVRDDCPLPESDRRIAHEVQTVGLALEIAARTDLLVFAPSLAARSHLRARTLVEIPVRGWHVSEPMHVVCHARRVTARLRSAVAQALHEVLA